MTKLTSLQKRVLELLSESSLKDKFYWTGGTALSTLYLHHRHSEDLDFFSDEAFSHNQVLSFVQELKSQLDLKKVEEKKIYDRWEFFVHNEEELRIEFVHYEHKNLKSRQDWKGIMVDSLEDIATNKTMTLFERNDPKDLVDLYFLLTEKDFTVEDLLKKTEQKFGVKFDEGSFWAESCRVLENLNDILPLLEAENEKERQQIIENIKEYFSSHSTDYLDKELQ